MNATLSFYECWLSGRNNKTLPTSCNQICLNFLYSQAAGSLKHCYLGALKHPSRAEASWWNFHYRFFCLYSLSVRMRDLFRRRHMYYKQRVRFRSVLGRGSHYRWDQQRLLQKWVHNPLLAHQFLNTNSQLIGGYLIGLKWVFGKFM